MTIEIWKAWLLIEATKFVFTIAILLFFFFIAFIVVLNKERKCKKKLQNK